MGGQNLQRRWVRTTGIKCQNHQRPQTNDGQQQTTTGGRARRFLVCGRRIRLDRRAEPGLPLPVSGRCGIARPTADHAAATQLPLSRQSARPPLPHPSAVARLNLRRVGQKSGKGLRPTTLLCLPHRLASELEAAHRSLVGASGQTAFPPASPPAPGPLPAGLQTGCVVR